MITLTCPGGVFPDGYPYPNGALDISLVGDVPGEWRDDLEFEWKEFGEQAGCRWFMSEERRDKRWSFWLGFVRIGSEG